VDNRSAKSGETVSGRRW